MSYIDIARNIENRSSVNLNKAMRIARTEGHRVTQVATYNAQRVAKDSGADIVKQWDSTLDRRTRKSHQNVDGEIRELDEPFSNGLMYPGDPNGKASEVVNCRCVLLQRAKWGLDEEELETLKQRAEYFGLDKAEGLEGFKEKYLSSLLAEHTKSGIINIEIDEFVPCLKENKTGKILNTKVYEITDRQSLRKFNEKNGWYINWSKVPKDRRIFALCVDGNSEIQGLVAYKPEPDSLAVHIHWAVANPKSNKKLTDNPEYNGIGGHLFAIIANESMKLGYDGFIVGEAANSTLLKHYIKSFGAEPIGGYRFYIDDVSARELLKKYNWSE